ncbi:MAG: decarboxylase [archaeon]|nr:decarboxylase [archaeon]MCR4323650.1 decarboxylase [Nanoarchaeota archaeon]
MATPQFVLYKSKLLNQIKILEDLGLKITYSYKTNREVGKLIQDLFPKVNFSIHSRGEIKEIKDKSKISFFTQAESVEELKELLFLGVKDFVVDNEIDLQRILGAIQETKIKISLSLRMKFKEHRIGSGKYFIYGLSSKKVNELLLNLKKNGFIERLGVHTHRKSQNTSEWEIVEELDDSLTSESLDVLDFVNLGGGLPVEYRAYTPKIFPYIFNKLKSAKEFLEKRNISVIIEPGRFLAAPCINLEMSIIQIYGRNLIVDTTIYNCALDTILTGTKMLVEGELENGNDYLIKGNSPTRDDIFRYNVKLDNPQVGDKIIFLNAGAYNYTTDFFGYTKIPTLITN